MWKQSTWASGSSEEVFIKQRKTGMIILALADQHILQSTDHNLTESHESNYFAAFQISKQGSQDVERFLPAGSWDPLVYLHKPKRVCLFFCISFLGLFWGFLHIRDANGFRKENKYLPSDLKLYSCVAMKNSFLQTTTLRSRIPAEPEQPGPEPSRSDWDPTGRSQVRNVWPSHRRDSPPRKIQQDKNQIHAQEKVQQQLFWQQAFSELTWCCCVVELLSIRTSKTGTGTDPRCCRPPSSCPVCEADFCRKERGLQEVRGVCGRGRLLQLQMGGDSDWVGKNQGGGGDRQGCSKDESHNKGHGGVGVEWGGCN